MAKKPAAKKRSTTRRQYNDILYEVKDQVAWATINRPRVLNAFREQTLDELIDALKSTREDPSIACAVVTGAGDKAFSAGGDFYAMKRLTFVNGAMWNDRMQGLAMTIRGCRSRSSPWSTAGAWAAATSSPCGATWSSPRRMRCSARPAPASAPARPWARRNIYPASSESGSRAR